MFVVGHLAVVGKVSRKKWLSHPTTETSSHRLSLRWLTKKIRNYVTFALTRLDALAEVSHATTVAASFIHKDKTYCCVHPSRPGNPEFRPKVFLRECTIRYRTSIVPGRHSFDTST